MKFRGVFNKTAIQNYYKWWNWRTLQCTVKYDIHITKTFYEVLIASYVFDLRSFRAVRIDVDLLDLEEYEMRWLRAKKCKFNLGLQKYSSMQTGYFPYESTRSWKYFSAYFEKV